MAVLETSSLDIAKAYRGWKYKYRADAFYLTLKVKLIFISPPCYLDVSRAIRPCWKLRHEYKAVILFYFFFLYHLKDRKTFHYTNLFSKSLKRKRVELNVLFSMVS